MTFKRELTNAKLLKSIREDGKSMYDARIEVYVYDLTCHNPNNTEYLDGSLSLEVRLFDDLSNEKVYCLYDIAQKDIPETELEKAITKLSKEAKKVHDYLRESTCIEVELLQTQTL